MRNATTIAFCLLLTLAAARPAQAQSRERYLTGLTVACIGGAGALVADFGSLIYIADLEYGRGWGWLSLLSGAATAAGGITIVNNERKARAAGSALIAFAGFSVAVGIAAIALPRRGTPYHSVPVALWPLVAPDSGGVSLGGVF